MITIPETAVLLPGTRLLIEFFNQLDQDMKLTDDPDQQRRIIMKAEYDLIMWGKV